MTTFEEQLRHAVSNAYDIERELGGGGMSRVFVATDKLLGRKVVIKLLSPELTAEVNRGRFRREIQVAAQLQHPHIVTLFSAGEDGDLVYYTMPFIKGESLKSALEKSGPLTVTEVVRILYDVTDALAYAHENGVVHRDIKPANILRSGSHYLVTDFGVAKALNAAMQTGQMTSTGMAVGTPSYMSPEQLAGDPAADHRIDIYAVGLLAYELLAGKSPFAAPTPKGVLAAVLTREPKPLIEVRPDVPRSLSEVVMRCLSKEPEARPQSAMELMAALDMFSTASGEIRTREHRVPFTPNEPMASIPPAPVTTMPPQAMPSTPTQPMATTPTAPVTRPDVPAVQPSYSEEIAALNHEIAGASRPQPVSTRPTTVDEVFTYEPARPRKSSTKVLLGAVVLLVPIAAAAFLLSQRSSENPSAAVALPDSSPVADSVLPQQPVTGSVPDSAVVVAPVVDSVALKAAAIKDSARKRAQAAKLAARAKADSEKAKEEAENKIVLARRAAAAMLANSEANKAFMRGATRAGGLLGTRRKGDLQTQIDALQPFLNNAGMTYQEFKRVAQESGVNLFDQFGRIEPAALQRFASGG